MVRPVRAMHCTSARERARADVLCVGLDKLIPWICILVVWGGSLRSSQRCHFHAPSLAIAHIQAVLQYADGNCMWQV